MGRFSSRLSHVDAKAKPMIPGKMKCWGLELQNGGTTKNLVDALYSKLKVLQEAIPILTEIQNAGTNVNQEEWFFSSMCTDLPSSGRT